MYGRENTIIKAQRRIALNITMKKTLIFLFILLTRIFGMIILASAILANQIGLDNDTKWGLGRLLIIIIGILVLLSPSIYQYFQNLKIQAGLVVVLILMMYVWQVSFGRWTDWPKTSNYFDRLATAFQHRQVSIPTKPDPSLLALKDPYDLELRTKAGVPFLWDLSLYKGNYYLYWGPVPALLMEPIKFFYTDEIGDQGVTFWFLSGMLIVNCLLAFAVWRDYFNDLPVWLFILGVTVLGTINPIPWLLHHGETYQAAISAGQFFLMSGLYWLYFAFNHDQPKILNIFIASVLFTGALGSRFILILPIGYILIMFSIKLYRENYLYFATLWNRIIPAIALPLAVGIIGLAYYNWIRFDSVFDFGIKYQINDINYINGYTFFSISYLPANIYNYFFLPFRMQMKYLFLKALLAKEYMAFGFPIPEAYYPEKMSGILLASPFVTLAGISIYTLINKNSIKKDLWWLIITLSGVTALSMGPILLYFFGTMRFIEDFMPSLAMLSLIGFWQGYKFLRQSRLRWAYTITSVAISIATIIIGVVLALSSSNKVPIFIPPIIMDWFRSFFTSAK
ncbi:MAG: hypothetical protein MUO77_05665 [Anaerolineales bacterium]|nr:hypothetical protein [Anaerolineales bacterium]